MEKQIVEVGMPLKKRLIYYHDMLQQHGLNLVFSCVTHDLYYSKNTNFDGLTENQIKNSCVRLRHCCQLEKMLPRDEKLLKQEKELIRKGYTKVFDTIKFDFHYQKEGMASRVQLQDILNLGLLAYYDNPNYSAYPPQQQRKLLIDELNTFGFNFKYSDLGLDKLRSFYHKKKMFSENQNG